MKPYKRRTDAGILDFREASSLLELPMQVKSFGRTDLPRRSFKKPNCFDHNQVLPECPDTRCKLEDDIVGR